MNLHLLVKRIAQTVAVLLALPAALLTGFGRIRVMYTMLAQSFALLPGLPGNLMRGAFYRLTLRDCSPDVNIAFGTVLVHPDTVIGPYVSIGSYCIVGRARIGARTQIASLVQIPSGRHQHPRDVHGNLAASVDGLTVIGAGCWIGSSAVVMAEVGDGTTIGAGAIVVKDIPAGVVAAGNPARVIRSVAATSLDSSRDLT